MIRLVIIEKNGNCCWPDEIQFGFVYFKHTRHSAVCCTRFCISLSAASARAARFATRRGAAMWAVRPIAKIATRVGSEFGLPSGALILHFCARQTGWPNRQDASCVKLGTGLWPAGGQNWVVIKPAGPKQDRPFISICQSFSYNHQNPLFVAPAKRFRLQQDWSSRHGGLDGLRVRAH